MKTITNEMATNLTLDISGAQSSLKELTRDVNTTTREWKAVEREMSAAGDTAGAVGARLQGLNSSIESQQNKINGLKTAIANTNTDTKKGAELYNYLQGELATAERKLGSFNGQQQRAQELNKYYQSGLSEINQTMQKNNDISTIRVQRLQAEGKEQEAVKVHADNLKNSQLSYNDILKIQQKELDETALANGKNSEEYHKAAMRVEETRLNLAKTSGELQHYQTGIKGGEAAIKGLNEDLARNNDLYKNNAERLQLEGREQEASRVKLAGLHQAYETQNKSISEQRNQLDRLKNSQGLSNSEYQKQRLELAKSETSSANYRKEIYATQKQVDRLNPYGFTKLGDGMNVLYQTSGKVTDGISRGFQGVKDKAVSASIGVGLIGAASVKGAQMASELENQYKTTFNLLVTGGEKATEAQNNVNKMQKDGSKMSVEYGVSQSKIADAYQELVKRGYSSEQALGSMKSMLQASVASGDDFTDVVHNSTAALESFGLKTDSVAGMTKNTKKTVNEMAFAADATATDFKSMGTAMEYVGSTAHQSGLDMSETASAIGILSNNGLEADKAGTGLRKVISSLQSPTIAASEALQGIGLSTKDFVDKSGKMKSMTEIFGLLNEHTQGMTKFKEGQLFHTLFGQTGQQAGAILSENADALGKLNNKVKDSADGQGYVAELSKKNMQSVKNELKQFQQAGEAVAIMIGKEMLPVLSEAATGMVKAFDSKDGQRGLQQLAKGVAGLFGAITNGVEFLGSHTTEVKIFAGALGTLWAVKKVGDFIGMVKSAKTALMELKAVEVGSSFLTKGASIGPLANKGSKVAGTVANEVESVGSASAGEALTMSRVSRTAVPTLGKTLFKTASAGIGGGVIAGLEEASSNKPVGDKVGGTIGATAGSAAGMAMGGPLGSMLGGFVGQKAGELLGDAIQKGLYKKPVKPKITFKTQNSDMRKLDKTYQGFISKLNTSLVVSPKLNKSGVDKDKKAIEKAYKEMGASVNKFYSDKQKKSKKDLDVLVKNGAISQKEEDKILSKSAKNNDKQRNSKKKLLTQMQNDSENYYKKLQKINDGNSSKLQKIEEKYGKKSKQYRDEQNKEREVANKKYQKKIVSDETKFGNDMSKATRTASIKQKDILDDLKKKKSKISKEEMREAISSSNTQKKEQIKDANDVYKSVVKSATKKRDETVKAADKEYYENGTISKKQHDDLIKQADGTYKDTVDSAKKQKKETVDHATEQHQKIVDQATKQAGEHKGAVDEETGNVINTWNVFSSGLANLWNGIAGGLNGILKAIGGKSWGKIPEWHPNNYINLDNDTTKALQGHARGHQGLLTDEVALVGEEGFELAHNPQQGLFTLGSNGPEIRALSAGTSILPHDRSKQFLAMTSGLPAHKDGVDGFISDAFNKVKEFAEDTTSVLTDGPGKLIDKVSDKLGFKPFIDSYNNAGTSFKDLGLGSGELIKKNFIESFTDMFKQKQEAEMSSKDIGAGGNWKDQILKAAKEAHVELGSGDLQAIMARINKESGGKQNIKQQINDINSRNGNPAQGLLQYIPPTFKSWAVSGHGNILSGYDQLMAMFNDSNWASDIRMPGGWGPTGHRRLENGGLTTKHQMVEISENNQPEMTIPISAMKSSRGYELLGKTMSMFAARDGLNVDSSSESKNDIINLNNKFDTMISLLSGIANNTARTNNGDVLLDRNELFKRQETDRNLSSLQNLGGNRYR